MSYYRLKDEDVSKHPHHRFSLTALMSPIRLSIRPIILNDVRQFLEYMQYQMMLPFLKKYKPRRRPITMKRTMGSKLNYVRHQVVKDWF